MERKVTFIRTSGQAYTKTVNARGYRWERMQTHTFYPRQENVKQITDHIRTIGRPFTMSEVIDSGRIPVSRTTAWKILRLMADENIIVRKGDRYILDDRAIFMEPIPGTKQWRFKT